MKQTTHSTFLHRIGNFSSCWGKASFTRVACLLLLSILQPLVGHTQTLTNPIRACLNGTTQLYWDASQYACIPYWDYANTYVSTSQADLSVYELYSDPQTGYLVFNVNPAAIDTFEITLSANFGVTWGSSFCDYSETWYIVVYEDTINAVITDATCPGQANGAISLTATGPYNNPINSFPFIYSWSGGQATNGISNIMGGQYDVMISDGLNCMINKSYQVGGDTVSLSTASTTVCTGATVQLSANYGTSSTTYTWQESSNNGSTWTNITGYINTSVTSYTSPPLTASKQYRVVSLDPNCTPTPTTSAAVTITVVPDPILTLTASNTTICSGAGVGLAASVSGGIGTFSYQWQEKWNNVWTNFPNGVNANVYFNLYANATVATRTFRVQVSQTGVGCNPIGVDTITITVLPSTSITVTPSPANATILCPGGSVTFTATGANTYTWTPSTGLNTTSGANVTASPSTSQTYTVTGTGTNGCTGSSQVSVTVYSYVNPYITQNITQTCYGTPITYSINNPNCYTSFPNPTFQWKVNGTAVAGATSNTFTSSNIHDNDAISLEINTGQSCHPLLTSNTIIADVVETGAMIVPTISISDVLSCSSTSGAVNLSASTTFGGSTPIFQWKKNGINVGTGVSLNTVANVGDIFTCEMTSSLACSVKPVTSNSISPTVTSGFLNGSYSCQTKEACIGDPITYCVVNIQNCDPTNCPSNYYYQNWSSYLSYGVQNDPSCYTYTLSAVGGANYDEVYGVNITSDLNNCNMDANGDPIWYPATFIGPAPILHYSSFTPTISISYTNVGLGGTTYLFTANTTGLGDNGTYQWKVKGVNALSGTYKQFASSSLQTGDVVTCTMTSSLSCATPSVVVSNPINISSTSVLMTSSVPNELILFPNPADVKIIVHLDMATDASTDFAINNLVGEEIIKWQGQSENGSYEQEISIENLASGVYFLTAKIEGRTMIQKFVKE